MTRMCAVYIVRDIDPKARSGKIHRGDRTAATHTPITASATPALPTSSKGVSECGATHVHHEPAADAA